MRSSARLRAPGVTMMRTRTARRPRLVVTGSLVPEDLIVPLARGELLVGSSAGSGLVLDVPGVSRMHARLVRDATGTWITDLRTVAGTQVNGQRILAPTLLS